MQKKLAKMLAGVASESRVVAVPRKGYTEGVSVPQRTPFMTAYPLQRLHCVAAVPARLQLPLDLRTASEAPLMPDAPWSTGVSE